MTTISATHILISSGAAAERHRRWRAANPDRWRELKRAATRAWRRRVAARHGWAAVHLPAAERPPDNERTEPR